jgi:tetratricopeptide (TPR) repeat protein
MRSAVIVALGDPRSSDAGTWIDAVTWLRQELTEFVFRVSVVEGENVERDLARALADIAPANDVLLHISGRLVGRGVVRTAGGRKIQLKTIGDALSARSGASVSIFAEFVYDGTNDARAGADHVTTIIGDFEARARGHAIVASVRPASAPIDGLALTRLFLGVARAIEPQGEFLSSAIYRRVVGTPESQACAQSFAYVRGAAERRLAPSMPSVPPPSAPDQVRELLTIARTLQANDDAAGALGALEQARDIDPMRVDVLQALRRGCERLGRWEEAFDAIGALVDLSPSAGDRAELRLAQAHVALDKLNDKQRAAEFLRAALECDPAHERALAMVRQVHAAPAAPASPVREVEAVPVEPQPPGRHAYASVFDAQLRAGTTDAAFLAALALEEVGAADAHHQALVDQLRSVAPIRALGVLDTAAWRLLRAPGSNETLEALFAQVGRAAVQTRLEELVLRKRLVALDPAARLDDSSTASVVRSFQWAARVLGVACPALYSVDEVPGEIAAVRAVEASTAVGPTVMRGRSAKDLAYLAGRHLTYYRPEHEVLVYFPTSADLTRLLKATIHAGARGRRPSRDRTVTALRDRLERQMTRRERADIAAAVRDFDEDVDLGTWTRSVELTAGRAGLLLCGDLATATAIIRSESRGIAGVSPEARREDLIAFCCSPEHSELRRRFAVTAPESQRQPPVAAGAHHSP